MSFFLLLTLVLPTGRPAPLEEVSTLSELEGDGRLSSDDNDGLSAGSEDDERLDAVAIDEPGIISVGGDSTAAVNIVADVNILLCVRIFNAADVITTPI